MSFLLRLMLNAAEFAVLFVAVALALCIIYYGMRLAWLLAGEPLVNWLRAKFAGRSRRH